MSTSMSMFELTDFAPPTPAWAEGCRYCVPDEMGAYDEAQHLYGHLPLTCSVCGDTASNRLLFEQSHLVNLGASWGRDALVCTSLDLRLNHLRYDILHGQVPTARDLTALELGWRFGPDGSALPPAGWRDGSHAVRCEAVAA